MENGWVNHLQNAGSPQKIRGLWGFGFGGQGGGEMEPVMGGPKNSRGLKSAVEESMNFETTDGKHKGCIGCDWQEMSKTLWISCEKYGEEQNILPVESWKRDKIIKAALV